MKQTGAWFSFNCCAAPMLTLLIVGVYALLVGLPAYLITDSVPDWVVGVGFVVALVAMVVLAVIGYANKYFSDSG